jgi:hypothetical protein
VSSHEKVEVLILISDQSHYRASILRIVPIPHGSQEPSRCPVPAEASNAITMRIHAGRKVIEEVTRRLTTEDGKVKRKLHCVNLD